LDGRIRVESVVVMEVWVDRLNKYVNIHQRTDASGQRVYLIEGDSELLGKSLPSVTTILQTVVNKPGLLNWASSSILKAVDKTMRANFLTDGVATVPEHQINILLDDAKARQEEERLSASRYGTIAHELLEQLSQGKLPDIPAEFSFLVKSWRDWVARTGIIFEHTESYVYHTGGFAGSFDVIGSIAGEKVLIDYKTSKGIYAEYALQQGGYKLAYEEMTGERIDRGFILKLPRGLQNGSLYVVEIKDLERAAKGFYTAFELYSFLHGTIWK
jgi:hypothetical protein